MAANKANAMAMDEFLSPEELERRLKISARRLVRMANAGTLPAYQIGSKEIRFLMSDVLASTKKTTKANRTAS